MNRALLDLLVADFLGAWNSQDVERVLDCYTDDVRYRDPNTRGEIMGRADLRRYLTRLFSEWRMNWQARETFDLAEANGAAFLWHATLRPARGDRTIEVDGMDLAVLRGAQVARNEVYFDRSALQSLRRSS